MTAFRRLIHQEYFVSACNLFIFRTSLYDLQKQIYPWRMLKEEEIP